ncbi:transposase [Streptomyces sp. NPDC085946]|uniref:transposase n=1 Tax=Streptomyces sp. NPDC085946 TaxID=3365744 RepID=UPI0037CCC4F4
MTTAPSRYPCPPPFPLRHDAFTGRYLPGLTLSLESSTKLGGHRWVVERTASWLAGCRRLHRRYKRKVDHFLAFTTIACALVCNRRLAK